MIFGIALLGLIAFLWFLLVRGFLWKLILFVFGWIGLYLALLTQPWALTTAVVFLGSAWSWAVIIPSIVCFLALLTTEN